jgi:choline dehydrogenase-like flavoprotein
MHTDARKMESGSIIEGDLCIVGAGAAGITMALEMMDAPFKVILLEGGGFDYDPEEQELYDGKTTGQRYYPLKSARLHYFGGTTGHWAGFCSPLDEIDFEKRDWVPHSGWPITRKELDPFYARAMKYPQLGPYEFDLSYWQKIHPEFLQFPFDSNVIWNKMWQFSPPTRFGTEYRDAIVKSRNVHLYTYANVTDITANEGVSSITTLTVKNFAGKVLTAKAKHYVLACSSIQNARLLLASNSQAPNGLGNDYDNVGRYFMEHLEIKSSDLYLFQPDPLDLYMIDYGVTKARAELAIKPAIQEKYRILNGTVSLTPLEIAEKMKPMIEIWSDKDPLKDADSLHTVPERAATRAKAASKGITYKNFELFTRIEQAPNPDSRVTLDRERDALGLPRPILHWVLTSFEKRSLRTIYEILGQQAGLAGIGRVKLMEYLQDENDNSWPSFTGGGWHHMGTTRMSIDPKDGVVDSNCKVHGISNLYTAGASCYVTAGAPNPTLTLITLAIRLSDHLKKIIG